MMIPHNEQPKEVSSKRKKWPYVTTALMLLVYLALTEAVPAGFVYGYGITENALASAAERAVLIALGIDPYFTNRQILKPDRSFWSAVGCEVLGRDDKRTNKVSNQTCLVASAHIGKTFSEYDKFCNRYVLEKCILIGATTRIDEHPEILNATLEALKDPCRFLPVDTDYNTIQPSLVAANRDQMGLVSREWNHRQRESYLNCERKWYEIPTHVVFIIYNVDPETGWTADINRYFKFKVN